MRAAAAIVMVLSAAGTAGARRPLVAQGFHRPDRTPKDAPETRGLPAELPARS